MLALPRQPCPSRDRLEFSTDDKVDDLFDIGLADEAFGDVTALEQHHDAIANDEQVLQAVRDEDRR